MMPIIKHSHKKRKDSLETRAVLLTFSLEPEIPGVAVQGIHKKHRKMAAFSENFFCENDFEAALAIFFSYGYRTNASEAVEKIAMKKIIKNVPCAA